MNNDKNIESSLIETLANQSIELSSDIAELSIDSFIDDEIIKEIPIFSFLYKGSKLIYGIRDALFAIKIYRFLKEFNSIQDIEKNKLILKVNKSKKEKIKIGQTLLMILDKIDDLNKTEIIANLFLAYIKTKINHSEFVHLSSIVQNCYLIYLKEFCLNTDFSKLDNEIQNILSSYGLMTPFIMDYKSIYGDSYIISDENNKQIINYSPSKIGYIMRKYAYKSI